MRLNRSFLTLGLVFLFTNVAESQQFDGQVILSAARSELIVGERLQLHAAGLTGGSIVNTGFDWYSSDENVLSISDTGLVMGLGVGNSWVTAGLNGRWNSMNVQVLPLRIELGSVAGNVVEGDTIQLQANAIDLNGAPIPDANFEWETSGPNGYYTRTAWTSDTGLFYAVAEGRVTVKASIPFWGAQQGQTERLTVSTEIIIERRKEFRLTRLVATDPLTQSFQLLPGQEPSLSVNDAGQIALISGLDGLTAGLLRYEGGNWDVLASAGAPGAFPQSYVWGFNGTAINNNGVVLTKTRTRGNSSHLVTASRSGTQIVLVEGQTQGSFQQIRNFTIDRNSLNDRGDIVFRGTYDLPGGAWDQDGIFKLSDGQLQTVWGATLPLAEFPDGFNIDYNFGVDAAGTAYFRVNYQGADALYSADGMSAPRKIIMTGDTLPDGSVAGRINGLAVAGNGTLAFDLNIENQGRVPAVYNASTGIRTMSPEELRSFDRIYSINNRGEVVFNGDVGDGGGFIRWDGTTSASVLLWDDPIGEARVRSQRDAVITSNGTIYAWIETTDSRFVVVEATSSTPLFQARDLINATASLNFLSFVPGALNGNPMIYTGGEPVAIHEVASTGLIRSWIPGQTERDSPQSGDLSSATRNPQGDLYFAAGDGFFRNGNPVETIFEYSDRFSYGLFRSTQLDWTSSWFEGGNYFAANDAGMLVWKSWSEDHHKLVSMGGGPSQVLASFGGSDPTVASSGESFAGLYWEGGTDSAIAVDDSGRIMANIQTLEGDGGAYLWENKTWNPVAVLNETTVNGTTISWVEGLRAAGNKFYAVFNTVLGGPILAEYSPTGWIPIVQTGGSMPNGAEIYWIDRDFEVNRRGDVAFVLNINGGTVIVQRNSDGVMRVVYRAGEATEDGDRFRPWRPFDIELRDDGTLYFIGINLLDKNVLYKAEPLF